MARKMKWAVCMLAVFAILGAMAALYYYFLSRMPDRIFLKAGCEQEINFAVPVKGTIAPATVEALALETRSGRTLEVDFSGSLCILTGESETYQANLKLFGILPYKTVEISVTDEIYLVPSGMTVGIYLQTEGVLVLETGEFEDGEGKLAAPAASILKAGDYIVRVNGSDVESKQQFMDAVEESQGEPLLLEVSRGGELFSAELVPVADEKGTYKVGIWIRDSTQGIGTVTYIEEDGSFGALGHGVTDSDTGELMTLEEGSLYRTEIVSIVKGDRGTPGEITGMIHYVGENILGSIEKNSGSGIFGTVLDTESFEQMAVPVAYKGEVRLGEAEIISSVSGRLERYSIEITGMNPASSDHRGLNILVTDERLLSLTGGIIQGMSGSPILQDGKLVGAVTHVLVSDPEKGYGIFIEDMLENAGG